MKITLISNKDMGGGAVRAAGRLFRGLRLLGSDARLLVREKLSTDPHVHTAIPADRPAYPRENPFREIEKKYFSAPQSPERGFPFSFPYPGFDLSASTHIRNADIVNLHHVRHFQSVESIARILDLGKPVVWTLHDQSAFTGGCHYAEDCRLYQEDCGKCPQLDDKFSHVPRLILQNKIRNWTKYRNLTVVTPSRWLAGCAVKSRLFGHLRIEPIANAVEIDVFRPIPKAQAKQRLDLHPGCVVILTASLNWRVKRKGFQYFMDSIRCCLRDKQFARDLADGRIRLLSFGKPEAGSGNTGIPLASLGQIDDDERLALIYSAADLFVLPSLVDNLPNHMLEALACGTPVVAFEVGGIPDVVRSGTTGLLVPPRDTVQMARAILDLARDDAGRERMARQGAELVRESFHLAGQANNYLRLFASIRADGRGIPAARSCAPGRPDTEVSLCEIDPVIYSQLGTFFSEFHVEQGGTSNTASHS